ncbi:MULTISPECIES: GGDEF domain-containing phosphodiesterase [Cryobacterium]|uniref:Phosphodiesterase n=1 Tax=Cryobacterium glucosi TaxID=1259175 RepID=A0ABY2IJB2_9MICO|nr:MULTISPECIES: GGDEF domain-containing phosphodiesterase [Cryobacterium]TFC01344.1 phosphodiesterase [Cryobacterium sp. MDB2-A-1]TFC09163.1 phosphodiesterase [Cryobacterium sp. MDB2-A-2]TFC18031.1 phosphodiesterase [Cryobacterium glucosi]
MQLLLARISAAVTGAMGLVVLAGWYLGASTLPAAFAGPWSMKPTPALALIMLSLALFLLERRRVALVLGLPVALLGTLTLAEDILGVTLGVDRLLPGIAFGGQDPRMAPATAVSLILLGIAVCASLLPRASWMLGLAFGSLTVSLLALLGYAYGASSLYTLGGYTSMALITALAVAFASVSILLTRPDNGLVGLLRDPGSSGRLLRPVVPLLLLGPFVLGWLRLWGQRQGWFDTVLGVAFLIATMTVVGIGLSWVAARRLRDLDRQRDAAMVAMDAANHALETAVDRRTRELAKVADTLHTLVAIAPVGIVQMDAAGGLLSANDQWRALSGLTRVQFQRGGMATAIHPDDTERVQRDWAAAIAAGAAYETMMRFRTPGGQVNWVQVSTAPIRDAGQVTGHMATVTDVTALHAAEQAVSAARARFEAAFASSPLGTAIVDLDGRVVAANPRLFELAGPASVVVGQHIEAIFMPLDAGARGARTSEVFDGPSTRQRMDRRMLRVDDEETWVKVSIAEIPAGEQAGALLYQVEDITARRLAEARVEHLAFHDPLTNLPNRLLLLDRLNQALLQSSRHGHGVAVLFIDLDRFKFVNDSLGHHIGDAVLAEVGVRLRQRARATDTVSRIGGDEFVILCPGVDSSQDVHTLAHNLQRSIAEPIRIGDLVASVDASIGIAFGLGHDDAEALLRNADQAMYSAKGRGRARYEVFDDDLRGRIDRRLDTELALRDAVELGEIETWYQPIVDLQENTVVATEALARWRRPERGIVYPGEFIAIAEEVGLIKGIGVTVLGQACRAAATLEGGLAVSVNVSPRQFAQDDFGVVVRRALAESGLPPERLWIELTESAVLEAIDSAARTFQELRELGVKLAIDDFGTGYSSFTHLRAFTVDLLKIDLTFVRDLERSEHDRAIVEGILRLADSLGLDVVAEGIETAGQRDLLRSMGCRYGQGYLFSRPDPSPLPVVSFDS